MSYGLIYCIHLNGVGQNKKSDPGAATSSAIVEASTITSPGTIARQHIHFIANTCNRGTSRLQRNCNPWKITLFVLLNPIQVIQ